MEDLDVLLNDLESMSYSKMNPSSNSTRNSYKSSLSSGSAVGMNQRFDRTSSDSIGSASYASNSYRPSNGNELFIEKINRLVNSNLDYNSMNMNRIEPLKPAGRYGDEQPRRPRESDGFNANNLRLDESNHSSSSNLVDFSELDNLLDDLAVAKQQFTQLNQLSLNPSLSNSRMSSNNRSSGNSSNMNTYMRNADDEVGSIVEFRNGISSASDYSSSHNKNSIYSSSSSPQSLSQSQSQYSSNSPTSTNNLDHKSIDSLNETATSSSSLCNNSGMNVTISQAHTSKAAQELDDLMASLSMYKTSNNDRKSTTPKSANRVNSNQFNFNDLSRPSSIKRESSQHQTPPSPAVRTRTSVNKNFCFSCQEPINGQVITALGCLWHPQHFVCHHCRRSIGTSIFYEKDNRPYCEEDYLKLFSPKCASCSLPILDKMLTALNKSWHISCFTCFSCAKMLNDESFLEINNKAFCKDCYVNDLAPKCKRCNEAITENFISALNGYWHPNCFVCTECATPFNSSSFFEHSNMPYCEIHYHLKRGSLCASCQQPINGRCITAMNKKYHPEHFTCAFCLNPLNKGTFKEKNDKSYCHMCFSKLFN